MIVYNFFVVCYNIFVNSFYPFTWLLMAGVGAEMSGLRQFLFFCNLVLLPEQTVYNQTLVMLIKYHDKVHSAQDNMMLFIDTENSACHASKCPWENLDLMQLCTLYWTFITAFVFVWWVGRYVVISLFTFMMEWLLSYKHLSSVMYHS